MCGAFSLQFLVENYLNEFFSINFFHCFFFWNFSPSFEQSLHRFATVFFKLILIHSELRRDNNLEIEINLVSPPSIVTHTRANVFGNQFFSCSRSYLFYFLSNQFDDFFSFSHSFHFFFHLDPY